MKTRQEMKALAKQRYHHNSGILIGMYLVFAAASLLLSVTPLGILSIFVLPVLTVCMNDFYRKAALYEDVTIESSLTGMLNGYLRKLGGMLWTGLLVFLWSLLFVIPGIVKAIAYSMTPYILAKYPNVKAMDAADISNRITRGYKVDLFVTALSFIGWDILSAFTFGILEVCYVGPYKELTYGLIFEELMQEALKTGVVRQEELTGQIEWRVE